MTKAIDALKNVRTALSKVIAIDEQMISNAAHGMEHMQVIKVGNETVLIHVHRLPKGWLENGEQKLL